VSPRRNVPAPARSRVSPSGDVPARILDAFVACCRDIARRGLVRCSSGNLSLRLDRDRLLIKASRSWMERLTREDVSVCRIADGHLLRGRKPSVEIGFHSGVLRARHDVNVVLHVQSPAATALACRRGRCNWAVIPEVPFYIGPVARVPYRLPGSRRLAEAVVEALVDHDLAVLDHHGVVTAAADLDHAVQNAEFFELACEVLLTGGTGVTPLPPRAVRELHALRRGPGTQA
jgi:ribulose-5-phosphate 4-epimerase/fuculose-1-phosphate aldolase